MKGIKIIFMIAVLSSCSKQKNTDLISIEPKTQEEIKTEKLTMSDIAVVAPTETAGQGDKLLNFKVRNLSGTNGKLAISNQSDGVYQTSTCKNVQNTILRASTSCEYKILFNGSLKPSGNYIFSLFVKDVDSDQIIGAVSFNYYHNATFDNIDNQLTNPVNTSGSSLCKVGYHQEGRACKNDIKPLIDPLKNDLKALSGYLQWNSSSRTYDPIITACQSSYILNNNICELNLVNAQYDSIFKYSDMVQLDGDGQNGEHITAVRNEILNDQSTFQLTDDAGNGMVYRNRILNAQFHSGTVLHNADINLKVDALKIEIDKLKNIINNL